jgi:serine protease Do
VKIRLLVTVNLVAVTLTFLLGRAFCLAASTTDFPSDAMLSRVCTVVSGDRQGSGLFVTAEGHILTNAHVVGTSKQVSIYYAGSQTSAKVLDVDTVLDLAVLSSGLRNTGIATFAEDSQAKVGMAVYAVGSPLGLPQTITQGIISTLVRSIDGQEYIQTDAAVNPGNSGGPLCMANGDVVGLLTLKSIDGEGIGFAIPVRVVLGFLRNAGIFLGQPTTGAVTAAASPSPTSFVASDDGKNVTSVEVFLSNPTVGLVLLIVSAAEALLILYLLLRNRSLTAAVSTGKRHEPKPFDIELSAPIDITPPTGAPQQSAQEEEGHAG